MTELKKGKLSSFFSSTWDEEFLIREILLTHDPDGRHIDSAQLLHSILEDFMFPSTTSHAPDLHIDAINLWEQKVVAAGSEETLGHFIYKISRGVLCKCHEAGDLNSKTMVLLEMLGHFRWDAKVALIIAAFAVAYGEFWLITQLCPHNPMATLIALIKRLPSSLSQFKPRLKALRLLIKAMVEVTKCIIKFEGLPMKQELLDDKAMEITKKQIYLASYWVFRSSLACSSQVLDMRATKNDQVCSNSTTIAAWELSSLAHRLTNSDLKLKVDMCQMQIETRLYEKLVDLFKYIHSDNQEVLHMLLALKDDLPLKHFASNAQVGISVLENKVVVLLISKPELLPIEGIHLLVQQIYSHHNNSEGSYETVWIPISSSNSWTREEMIIFEFLSNSLPWLSIRQPWLLSPAITKFFKQDWNFKEEPIMVTLDLQGIVTNLNAVDMVLVWGTKAFPFSSIREKELWEEEHLDFQFLIDKIDPFLAMLVEKGENLCIYGSNNIDWVNEFKSKMNKIRSTGVELEVIYAGWRDPNEQVKNIAAIINEEKPDGSLTFMKICFFWLRLKNMRKSILGLGHTLENYTSNILDEVSWLLDIDEADKGWAVIGKSFPKSAEIVKLKGEKVMEFFGLFPVWGENIAKLGLVGAIRAAFDPPQSSRECCHFKVIPYDEGLIEGRRTIVCEKCKRPMDKFVMYE